MSYTVPIADQLVGVHIFRATRGQWPYKRAANEPRRIPYAITKLIREFLGCENFSGEQYSIGFWQILFYSTELGRQRTVPCSKAVCTRKGENNKSGLFQSRPAWSLPYPPEQSSKWHSPAAWHMSYITRIRNCRVAQLALHFRSSAQKLSRLVHSSFNQQL